MEPDSDSGTAEESAALGELPSGSSVAAELVHCSGQMAMAVRRIQSAVVASAELEAGSPSAAAALDIPYNLAAMEQLHSP